MKLLEKLGAGMSLGVLGAMLFCGYTEYQNHPIENVDNEIVLSNINDTTIMDNYLDPSHRDNTTNLPVANVANVVKLTEYDEEQIRCLALNVYHEARGESITGQRAVAHVTINRANHEYFPNSVCSVVWQKSQFSWTIDGKSDRARNRSAYDLAYEIATLVYTGEDDDDPTHGAVFYHASYVKPKWSRHKSMTRSVKLGKHIFYTWTGTWV